MNTRSYEELLSAIQRSGARQEGSYFRARAELDAKLMQDQIESTKRISQAAQKTADSLKRATWILSFATAVLAIATIALFVATVSD